jgi:GAT domain
LIGDMNLVKGNINLTNEIIDSVQPGENNETLNDLFNTLTSMEPKLFNLIGQIENEEVMQVCLLVNDDL